jgi:hypothetical protein
VVQLFFKDLLTSGIWMKIHETLNQLKKFGVEIRECSKIDNKKQLSEVYDAGHRFLTIYFTKKPE